MGNWQEIDTPNGKVEIKVTNKLMMVRAVGQTTEYPHTTVKLVNGEPDFSTLHHSDPANQNRFGMREIISTAARIAANKDLINFDD